MDRRVSNDGEFIQRRIVIPGLGDNRAGLCVHRIDPGVLAPK